MATTICLCSPNGGAGTTTTALVLAFALSINHKVLVIDLGVTANLSETIAGYEYDMLLFETGVYEALAEHDVRSHIRIANKNLHVLFGGDRLCDIPSDIYLGGLSEKDYASRLRTLFSNISSTYEYVVIDSSAHQKELMLMSFVASDFIVIPFVPNRFKHSLKRMFSFIETVQKNYNTDLRIAGILRTNVNDKYSAHQYFLEEIKAHYGTLCLNVIIPYRADIGRLGTGVKRELSKVLDLHKQFVDELLGIVGMDKKMKVTFVKATETFELILEFDSSEWRFLNIKTYLNGEVGLLAEIRDKKDMFMTASIDDVSGTVFWSNGVDFDPQVLYEKSTRFLDKLVP